MGQFRVEPKRARRLPGGSSLAIAQRWPASLVERYTAAGAARWPAWLDELDDDHDGWQPVRLRHDEQVRSPKAGAAVSPGAD